MPRRFFVVIPAAGLSRRMGQPKLLLRVGGATIIDRMLSAFHHPGIAATVVVVRADDEPLRIAVQTAGGTVIQPPQAPPDMRTSVEFALAHIREHFHPDPDDVWILVPADHPLLDSSVMPALISGWNARQPQILIPTHAGQRGHPTLFRWDLADEVPRLPLNVGLNHLVKLHSADVTELPVDTLGILLDLDTPADYAALLGQVENSPPRGA
ncbi:MAG: nucleotidyltransferase family protein [Planctomycetales bacterium]|nr:nucleotidyltransferase family protein [Planctomycetales bacterium]